MEIHDKTTSIDSFLDREDSSESVWDLESSSRSSFSRLDGLESDTDSDSEKRFQYASILPSRPFRSRGVNY